MRGDGELRSHEDLERFVTDHEAGVLDVMEAYEGAAVAYAAAAGWQPVAIVASSTSPVPAQRS